MGHRLCWLSYQLSIEKRGKIQTTKMNKFSNLNICSTKREPNPQWPLTATIGLNFWSEVGSPIPMTSQWPQTAFARLLLICSLILDLSSTGLIKKRGTQCFKSRKREPYPWRTSQKFKPNPNEIFLRSKNIFAWVRFKFLGNQAFLRGCGGLPPLGSASRIWLG